ncbi:heme-binding protein 2-like [Asterias amurensis]|uniref:heme-binding protein 2-like n=1 Tax=Asterias amurensis TaxID=7602 RepID=UPI003AB68038
MADFKLILLIAFASVCVNTCRSRSIQDEPPFCRGLECPHFTSMLTTKDYEFRAYPASKWVSTTIIGADYKSATSEGFDKLFQYISGQNSQKQKIEMTAPVINRVIPGQGPTCADNFTVSFMVPFELQANTPMPTDSTIFMYTLPAHKSYVRSYTGFSDETKFLAEAQALAGALNSTQTYDQSYFYTAGYDSPFNIFNRHNEVWFIV